jgi:hypothetical protein
VTPVTRASCGRRPGDHRLPALGVAAALEVDEHEAAAGARAAGERHHRVHRRVVADDLHQLPQLVLHRLERDALVGADAAVDLARVLLREEALGDAHEQEGVERDHQHQHQQHQPAGGQRPVQADLVGLLQPAEAAFGPAREAPWLALVRVAPQQPGAHHRRGGQRDQQRDHHRRRQRHRELAEQPAHLAAHEQQRDEHGDQRQADRQHGEADLARAAQRRLEAVHALLDVARGVLQHHDGVVHHEAGGHRQRHQRQVVEREAQHPHHAEGAQQRDDGGHRRG